MIKYDILSYKKINAQILELFLYTKITWHFLYLDIQYIKYIDYLCIMGGVEMKISKELVKGSTTMLILEMLNNENMYGYQLIKKLSEKSNNVFELKEGTLYPILHSLEENSLITSYWDETTAKKRKYYSITQKGKKSLKEKKEEWKIFSKGITNVIGGVSFAN